MSFTRRLIGDIIGRLTCVALLASLVAKVGQMFIHWQFTDYFPMENIPLYIIGMIPTLLLLGYMIGFYKTEKSQILLVIVFAYQTVVNTLSAWADYNDPDIRGSVTIIESFVWIAYYAFLVFVTYKDFANSNLVRVVIAVMSIYVLIGSVTQLIALITIMPGEIGEIVAKIVDIVGHFCYCLAVFLIVPKYIEDKN